MPTGVRTDPYRGYRFRVEVDGLQTAAFQELTVPSNETKPLDYREGTDPTHLRKLSGMTSYGNLTLKKGLSDSMELYNWYNLVLEKGASAARKSISLVLLDDEGKDSVRWNIVEAWPTKYETSGLNAQGEEVMVETMEIVHEGITRVS